MISWLSLHHHSHVYQVFPAVPTEIQQCVIGDDGMSVQNEDTSLFMLHKSPASRFTRLTIFHALGLCNWYFLRLTLACCNPSLSSLLPLTHHPQLLHLEIASFLPEAIQASLPRETFSTLL